MNQSCSKCPVLRTSPGFLSMPGFSVVGQFEEKYEEMHAGRSQQPECFRVKLAHYRFFKPIPAFTTTNISPEFLTTEARRHGEEYSVKTEKAESGNGIQAICFRTIEGVFFVDPFPRVSVVKPLVRNADLANLMRSANDDTAIFQTPACSRFRNS